MIIKILKKYLNSIQELANYKLNDLEKTRKELDEALGNQKHKIVIALDDIDRLNVQEIHLIFQLIKILADFPNTVYLIGFDREVVSAALTDEQTNLSGSDYLEKIIQVIFEIPHITEDEVHDLVIENLEKEFDKFNNENESYYFDGLYNSVLKYKFRNIRNVNRYINTLKLTYEMVKDDVFNVDYYALTALQVFLPELYHFVKKNQDLLLYDYQYSMNYPSTDKETIKKQLHDAITNLNLSDIPIQNIESFLQVLFPNLKRIYTNEDNRHYTSEWQLNKRLCTRDNFDTYFKCAVPSWEISKEEFDKIVYSDTDEMLKRILTLPSSLQIKFINQLDSVILNEHYKFSENNKKCITETMYCIGDKINDENNFYPYIVTVEHIVVNLLKTMNVESAFVILKHAITKSNNLHTICELSYGIFSDLEKDEPEENRINLKESHVDELKLIITKKIKNFLISNDLREAKMPFFILQSWKKFGNEKEVNEYMETISESNLIMLIKILTKNKGLSEKSVSEAINNLNELMDIKTLNNKLDNIISSTEFEKKDVELVKSFNEVLLKLEG